MSHSTASGTDPEQVRSAPVEFARLRARFQRVRAALAFAMVAVAAAGAALGAHGGWLLPIPPLIVAVDGVIHIRVGRRPMFSFLIDAAAGWLLILIGVHALAPMVALMAYLVTGSLLLLSARGAPWVIGTAAVLFSVAAPTLSSPQATDDSVGTLVVVWGELLLFLTATALILLAATSQIRAARVQQADALEAERRASDVKTQFVSMVSHELRTPLTNISGFTDTLSTAWRTLEPDEIDEFLAIIHAEAEHLGNLVDDVLAIPKLEAGRLLVDITDFRLRPLAYRIADLAFPSSGGKSASVSVSGGVVVRADPNRVEQVLRNLLDNARKYGGDQVGIEAVPRGDTYVVVVADNGPGIPEAARDRIFEEFEQVGRGDTRTDSGVGLGLTVTRRLVEAMNGEVWYEPGFPVGARFCFTLPAGSADLGEPAPRQPDRERVAAPDGTSV